MDPKKLASLGSELAKKAKEVTAVTAPSKK